MITLETIMNDTIFVGKYYSGGRIVGTYSELEPMDSEFKELDIVCTEGQPEHLREFYEGYNNQDEYYTLQDYYNKVYSVRV